MPHTQGPALLIRLECESPIDEGVASFLPPAADGAIDLATHLSPKAQRLLRLAEGGGDGEGVVTEAGFRAALAADACGTQVFAQGMKLFLTVCAVLSSVCVMCVCNVCVCGGGASPRERVSQCSS